MKWILIFCLIYGVFVTCIYLFQNRLLFFPDQTPFCQCIDVLKSGGETYEDSEQNVRYYLIKSKNKNSKGWLLHFHGNGGRACDRFLLLKNFLPLGYHLVLAEYPGYAEASSLPINSDEILNAASAIHNHIIQINTDNLPIILYGESLGTAPATYLAYKNPNFVKALILQTPFPSITRLAQSHYPFLPVKLILRFPFPVEKWATLINTPIFTFHGATDEIIPIELGREQFDNFSSEHKEFWDVPYATHNDLLFIAGPELWEKIETFLSPLVPEPEPRLNDPSDI